ncbi:UNC-like C-terminal-domain-containing protein [Xylaria bambusicola]|uniref:UNC-like C-terminal-domain-containing protein n=1 Tax=Xylaria bambusicola TaxID=326684 RepID=UPI0020083EF9|nr:UNC-like C-terminal-domain-containing protein [Xylaria bambusicola]KAI0527861.1 UNC-like C-terminal-domain-containing protein [Xylaria bambusicola]
MWPLVEGRVRDLALILLVSLFLPHATYAQGDGPGASGLEPTCESRTVNYITDSLPQQCLTTGSIGSLPTTDTASITATVSSTSASADPSAHASDAVHDELDPEGEDLSTGAFMSFEEWKAMMLAKSGPDALDAKTRRQRDGRPDAGPGDSFDSLGDEGEISFDFDSYSDKISEIASSARPREHEKETKEQVEVVAYDEGFTYYRSKDAGTTCKERFSYSSFDAGATVKKTSPGAKNPTAILVENKDSYMLLECGRKNKFFIVELSDVILVDTVVIANFEFFSSMVREFRVSISDRYPVKLDKWKVLGNFQARNSRDIQPFLIENPQDWARYLRVEILSHYGNEYYCPVSLLRVHGLRMLDSWKQVDPSELEGEDENPTLPVEPVEETFEVADEPPVETEVIKHVPTSNYSIIEEQSCWTPYWDRSYFDHAFVLDKNCAQVISAGFIVPVHSTAQHRNALTGPQSASSGEQASSTILNGSTAAPTTKQTSESSVEITGSGSSVSASTELSVSVGVSTAAPSSPGSKDNASTTASNLSASQTSNENATIQNTAKGKPTASTSVKPPSSRSSAKASSSSQTAARSKPSGTVSAPPPGPTVQDSFFKALTKRLQILETNTTLSLQYIESQSRFLQEALAKLERRQIAKVDLFLDKLNNTVLGELREVRTLYDHIWQSTVIALESQREQAEHEIVALSTRVGVLADEVAFQKRMAIVQSVLLLGCLVLVIFSRGFAGSAVEAYYPAQFLTTSSRLASPTLPSTPKAQQLRVARLSMGLSGDSANTTPARSRPNSHSTPRGNNALSAGGTPKARSRVNSNKIDSDPGLRPPTPSRARSDPSGLDFQPPTPSSIEEMAYDSEPAMTPGGDYFSAVTSVNGDPSTTEVEGEEEDDEEGRVVSMTYPEMLAMQQSERQLTPTSETEGEGLGSSSSDYSNNVVPSRSSSGRPGLTHSGSTRKPLPALPEDPD